MPAISSTRFFLQLLFKKPDLFYCSQMWINTSFMSTTRRLNWESRTENYVMILVTFCSIFFTMTQISFTPPPQGTCNTNMITEAGGAAGIYPLSIRNFWIEVYDKFGYMLFTMPWISFNSPGITSNPNLRRCKNSEFRITAHVMVSLIFLYSSCTK